MAIVITRCGLSPENFRDLIEAMLLANACETIKAIGNVLKDGIPAPISHQTIVYRTKLSEPA